jgi:tRNA (guanine-N7-)-methyltransferase
MNEQRIRSFQRRSGRVSNSQHFAIEELLPRYGYDLENRDPSKAPFPLQEWTKGWGNVVLEIGFGMGEATIEIARKQPDTLFIAVEVHKSGVGRLLNEIERNELANIRIVHGDADLLIESHLSKNALSGVHIFFPDPWPKKRHHKRRLLKRSFMDRIAQKIEAGGYLYAVTDWEPYAEFILSEAEASQFFHNPYRSYAPPIPWRPETRFEKKGLTKAHLIREIWLERV